MATFFCLLFKNKEHFFACVFYRDRREPFPSPLLFLCLVDFTATNRIATVLACPPGCYDPPASQTKRNRHAEHSTNLLWQTHTHTHTRCLTCLLLCEKIRGSGVIRTGVLEGSREDRPFMVSHTPFDHSLIILTFLVQNSPINAASLVSWLPFKASIFSTTD